jgi:hypothetical protein
MVRMPTDTCPLPEPRSGPAAELRDLFEQRAALAKTVADASAAATYKSGELQRAEQALVQAERARLNGSGSTDAVAKAEKTLVRARAEAAQPWAARAAAAREALRDLDGRIARHAAENYGELRDEVDDDARAAADAIDGTLRDLQRAYAFREEVAGRATRLWGLVAHPRPNLTPETRIARLATEAETVLEQGGEPPPTLPESHLPANAEMPASEEDEPADVVAGPRSVFS